MIGWIVGKLKSLFLIAAVGGPAFAGYLWYDAQRIANVETNGVETTALISGATRSKSRRGRTSYDVNLAWKDAKGQMRSASNVNITGALADKIIRDDKIVRNVVKIKYLADDMAAEPILIEDAGRQLKTDNDLMYFSAGAGTVGIVGSLLFFLIGRRRGEEEA